MSKTLTEIAHEIVQAQASAKQMTMEEIRSSLQETFQMLKSLQEHESGGEGAEGADQAGANIEPKKSIKKNSIICLECGAEFKMLSAKHLAAHGMDARSYRAKYGLSARQSLCAKSLSDRRSESGKQRGLPENLIKYLDARSAKKQAREAAATSAPEVVQQQAEATAKKPRGRKKTKKTEPQE